MAYGIPKFRRIPLCGGEMAYVLSIVEQLCGHIGRRVEYTSMVKRWMWTA